MDTWRWRRTCLVVGVGDAGLRLSCGHCCGGRGLLVVLLTVVRHGRGGGAHVRVRVLQETGERSTKTKAQEQNGCCLTAARSRSAVAMATPALHTGVCSSRKDLGFKRTEDCSVLKSVSHHLSRTRAVPGSSAT